MRVRDGWGSWTLSRRLQTALVAVAAVIVVAGLVLVVVLRQADEALSDQAERTFPARLAASQLLTSLVDQETGLRGYVLTGDEDFLAPYQRGLVNEQESRAELEALIAPTDPARLSLGNVDAAITAWREQYAALRTGPTVAGSADGTIEFGRQLFVRVREANAELDARLAEQLTDAEREADEARDQVVIVLGVMGAVVVLTFLGLQRALKNSVLRPMAQLAAQVAVVSGGEHAASIRPEGPPDLRAMGSGVESMRLELVGVLDEVERHRQDLQRKAAELARSNADLEQFAYVASHDLQEPLRKITSFCELLERRYRGELDDRADQYLSFVIDGATRMQALINDLLRFSRVGRTSEGFAAVDLASVIEGAWSGLERPVAEAGGRLSVELAPDAATVHGDRALLGMLISNVLGNAVKYARPGVPPVVQVTSCAEAGMVRVDVADNGIGIDPEFEDKIFVIFQRLHRRDAYEGTGIGLALAKRIVEFHGGEIGLRPSPLGGACISFTLRSTAEG